MICMTSCWRTVQSACFDLRHCPQTKLSSTSSFFSHICRLNVRPQAVFTYGPSGESCRCHCCCRFIRKYMKSCYLVSCVLASGVILPVDM